MAKLVLTAIGDDRPGLVQALSTALDQVGGNWLESEFLHLVGQFAGIALVELPDAQVRAFEAATAELAGRVGLRVELTDAGESTSSPTTDGPSEVGRLRLHLVGQDRPGTVRQITSTLAEQNVTIEEFSSWTHAAPEGGGMLFEAEATIELPEGLDADAVRTGLEAIAGELMVDLELT